MRLTRRIPIALLASTALAPLMRLKAFARGTSAKSPARNPFLSAEKYGTTHFNPAWRPAKQGSPLFAINCRMAAEICGRP